MIKALYSNDTITSLSSDAFALYEKSKFGERNKDKIEYSIIEALFLVEEGRMQVYKNSREITSEQLVKIAAKTDKRVYIKFPVYKVLRKKGYIIKTALKFGADFRVYDKGVKPREDHAKWLLYPVKESELQSWYDFAAKNRVAHAARKNLLIGILDEEGDVTFYEINWVKT